MRRLVKIVSEEEYALWLSQQRPYYLESIRNTDDDPFTGQVLDAEVKQRREDFMTLVESALAAEGDEDKTIALSHIGFETGGAQLTAQSRFAVQNLVDILKKYPSMRIEVRGHTDNTGDAAANLELSKARANAVYQELVNNGIDASRLTATGYGDTLPVAGNDTEDGRQQNRRTEFKILTQ